MNTIRCGVWPTMITPYSKDGKVNYHAVKEMVDWYVSKGCDGIFAVCQSSEMFYLSLEERVSLAKAVVDAADGRLDVVASGHISDDPAQQLEEADAIGHTGVKAFVLVSNRLASSEEDDNLWIANAENLLGRLPDLTFGVYECPWPYKRLMSDATLGFCAASGRFSFLKDTCCDARLIRRRIEVIRESAAKAGKTPLGLYNANTMTLLESLRDGAAGYSGVMGNLHPELYAWLYANWQHEPQKAEELQSILTLLSSLENQAYPICAKQHMNDCGISMELTARNLKSDAFGYTQQETLRQAEILEGMARRLCGIE